MTKNPTRAMMISASEARRAVFNRASKCACSIPKGDRRTPTSRLTKPDASAPVTAANSKPFDCLPLTCAVASLILSLRPRPPRLAPSSRPWLPPNLPPSVYLPFPRKSDSYKTTCRLLQPYTLTALDDVYPSASVHVSPCGGMTSAAITIAGFLAAVTMGRDATRGAHPHPRISVADGGEPDPVCPVRLVSMNGRSGSMRTLRLLSLQDFF